LTLPQAKKLDAAYHWSQDGGRSFPLRGRGITLPTLGEALAALPGLRFNIDIKQVSPAMVNSVCREIREHGAAGRVLVASFDQETLDAFRRECAGVATAAGVAEVRAFLSQQTPAGFGGASPRALQVPEYGTKLLTPGLIAAAHLHDIEVHAWTINDEAAMRRLIDWGVDGIITDYPDRLMALLSGRS
jgi:glycerophosphoryl diester phosphodiesterase